MIKVMKKSPILIIVLAVLIILVGVVAVLRMHHKTTTVNSYDACVNSKGSRLLTTYPEVCITSGNQRFTKQY